MKKHNQLSAEAAGGPPGTLFQFGLAAGFAPGLAAGVSAVLVAIPATGLTDSKGIYILVTYRQRDAQYITSL